MVTATCKRCGRSFERVVGRRRDICHECGKQLVLLAASNISNKAGPVYEKAVRSQVKYWRSEAKRLGISV